MKKPLARVTVEVQLEDEDLGSPDDDAYVETLETAINKRLAFEKTGRLDGHEFGGGWAVIYCYGRDGARLSDVVLEAIFPIRASRQLCVVGTSVGQPDEYKVLLSRSRGGAEIVH